MIFNEIYYRENNLEQNHNHYQLRARWIRRWMKGKSGRVVIIGAGLGWTVRYLDELGIDVIGIEKSKYACKSGFAGLVNKDIKDFQFISTDNIFSWNVLDCLKSEKDAEKICQCMNVTNKQIHILCIDNEDKQSEQYKKDGYFIKPMQYWMKLLPMAILVNYHTGGLYNLNIEISDLKIPLSWNLISK